MLSPYRKLIAALVGMGLLVLSRRYGVDLRGSDSVFVDVIVESGDLLIMTAAGFLVWLLPNRKPLRREDRP